jgi:hypothetical protein
MYEDALEDYFNKQQEQQRKHSKRNLGEVDLVLKVVQELLDAGA